MQKNDPLKYWLNQLGKNMNNAISASGPINHCIKKIKDQGFDLNLFLEATVCVSQDEEESPLHHYKKLISTKELKKRRKLRLNRNDRDCLQSMKIKVTREKR